MLPFIMMHMHHHSYIRKNFQYFAQTELGNISSSSDCMTCSFTVVDLLVLRPTFPFTIIDITSLYIHRIQNFITLKTQKSTALIVKKSLSLDRLRVRFRIK